MRAIGAILLVAATLPPESAVLAQANGEMLQLAAVAAKKKSAPAAQPRGAYSAMPLAERVALQFDLAWSGDYNGLINGDINDRSIAAVKSYQKGHGSKETGALAPAERTALAQTSKQKQEQVGWRMVDDNLTGAQVGLPATLVPNTSRGKTGIRWSSAQGQIQIETFRTREPGTTLADIFEQQKKEPATRKVEVNVLRSDFFIVAGAQGLKKFYVRAEIRDGEVRGLTVLYDLATQGIMDPVTVVMSSAFAPFSGSGIAALIGPLQRRKVEYSTGIVASTAGHVLADRQATDGCHTIELAGRGGTERVAEDETAGIALLRVYGARITPAALALEGAKGTDLALVGIADPQAQGGGNAVSSVAARLSGGSLQPAPPAGFAGAAALDAQGRVLGMVRLTAPVLASAAVGGAPAQASLVDAQVLRKFLEAQNATPATEPGGIEAAKAALVRVICVRR